MWRRLELYCQVRSATLDTFSCNKFLLEFQFHVTDAILGCIVPDSTSDEPMAIPYINFIATPLLSCARADGPIHKFTGNDDPGETPAKSDFLTQAIHAF